MARVAKGRKIRLWVVTPLVAAFVGYICWDMFRVRIVHASEAEIRAVLPPELLIGTKVDQAAAQRLDRLSKLAEPLASIKFSEYDLSKEPRSHSVALARQIWIGHQVDFESMKRVLNEGPLQFRPRSELPWRQSGHQSLKQSVLLLSFAARTMADSSEWGPAVSSADLAENIAYAALSAGGDGSDYFDKTSIGATADKAVEHLAELRSCPRAVIARWLSALPACTIDDPLLASAMGEEFRGTVLPLLMRPEDVASIAERGVLLSAIPSKWRSKAVTSGTYDPIETARLAGHLALANIANSSRPFSELDPEPDEIVDQLTRGLPEPPRKYYSSDGDDEGEPGAGSGDGWQTIVFRFVMNNSSNSIGRFLIGDGLMLSGRNSIIRSCRQRAKRQALRTLLASVLYRHDHNGSLPGSLSDLVPRYLSAVPIDPFNGKALLYSRTQAKVWSVGQNLVDDGGEISSGTRQRDIGLSLDWVVKHSMPAYGSTKTASSPPPPSYMYDSKD